MSIRNTIEAAQDGCQRYDAVCKEILSSRQILANIMKEALEEYRDCSVEDIVNCYIEPESISLSKPVYRNQAKVLGTGGEDSTITEGKVIYDVIFRARFPDPNGKMLEKVYSIWICMGSQIPKSKQFTASLYRMDKHDIIGEVKENERHYNLMSAVIIRLGTAECADSPRLLRLLWSLFGGEMKAEERIARLGELGIQVDSELREEVNEMCNLSEGILEKGAAEERRRNAAAFYRSGVSLEIISKSMGVPMETVKQWVEEEAFAGA